MPKTKSSGRASGGHSGDRGPRGKIVTEGVYWSRLAPGALVSFTLRPEDWSSVVRSAFRSAFRSLPERRASIRAWRAAARSFARSQAIAWRISSVIPELLASVDLAGFVGDGFRSSCANVNGDKSSIMPTVPLSSLVLIGHLL